MIKGFQMVREFMEIQGDLFEIVRRIREQKDTPVDAWKEHLGADKVFRKDGFLFFCRQVEEAQIVEDEVPVIESKTENE